MGNCQIIVLKNAALKMLHHVFSVDSIGILIGHKGDYV